MPIYAYKCESCGAAKDVLRKISDPALTDCPFCGKPSFRKQVTAAGFQLKGSGWYVTDFRGGSGAAAGTSTAAATASTQDSGGAPAGAAGSAESAAAAPAASTAAAGKCA